MTISNPPPPSDPTPPTSPTPPAASDLPPPATPPIGMAATGPVGADSRITVVMEHESLGRSVVRTALKALVVLALVSIVPFIGLLIIGSMMAAVVGGSTTQGDITTGAAPTTFVAGDRGGDTRLVAVPIVGPILGENRDDAISFFGSGFATYGYTVKEQLAELADDDDVDGILLEMSTPGGTIFGSKAIADGVAAYQAETGKPVVAYVADISASGGMYAMAGADEIVADHGTLTGSIGVIFGPFVHYDGITAVDGGLLGGGVTTSDGITFEYLTAGRNKDIGSPYRPMTDEERRLLQEGLDDAYDEFVAHVADGRGLTTTDVTNGLGAHIFGEQQALKRGLIDAVGSREAAHDRLAELAGASGDDWRLDRVIEPGSNLFQLFGASLQSDAEAGSPTAGLPLFCTAGPTVLAYHGDPTQLCAGLASQPGQ